MSTEFRLATLHDAEIVAELVNSAYRGESSKQGWTTEADFLGGQRTDREGISDIINEPNSQIVLYFQEQKLIGCVNLKKQNEKCYLGMLTVKPTQQNSGTGRKLLEYAESFAVQQLRCTKIYMTVIDIRAELIAWYVRRGYTNTGLKSPFPSLEPRFGIPKRNDLVFTTLEKSLF